MYVHRQVAVLTIVKTSALQNNVDGKNGVFLFDKKSFKNEVAIKI